MGKTIKVIDLIIKLANGEFDYNIKVKINNKEDYVFSSLMDRFEEILHYTDFIDFLNYPVEIIEEDKDIRKLPPYKYEDEVLKLDLAKKIDELTEAINELKKGK